jgi:purine-binding chemotaxis protein CheW
MNASVDAGHIMGVGCVKYGDVELLSILADIEALMNSAVMGLIDAMH